MKQASEPFFSSYSDLSLRVSMGLQPLQNQSLVSLLVGCVRPDVVLDNDEGTVIRSRVLTLEELGNIIADRVVSKLGQTHTNESLEDNVVRGKASRDRIPVRLEVLPQQVAHLGVSGQSHRTAVDVLNGYLVREDKVQVIGDKSRVLGASHGGQADLLAVHGVRPQVLLLDGIVLLATALRHVEAEDRSAQVGVDRGLILTGRPEIESALGLGDDAKRIVVSKQERKGQVFFFFFPSGIIERRLTFRDQRYPPWRLKAYEAG